MPFYKEKEEARRLNRRTLEVGGEEQVSRKLGKLSRLLAVV